MEKEYYCPKCRTMIEPKIKVKWCQFSKEALEVGFDQKENMQIVGESRDKRCWWVKIGGMKTRYSYWKDYIKQIK